MSGEAWPKHDLAMLAREWGRLTARAIGRRCDPQRTRKAVIRMAHRLRLPPLRQGPRLGTPRAGQAKVDRRLARAGRLHSLPVPAVPPPAPQPVRYMPGEGCAWPVSGERTAMLRCDLPRRDRACPYCEAHAARAYAAKAAE